MEGGGGRGSLLERRAYFKFFERERQNYTMSMEFEMLRSFENNYELLHYTANTIKIKSIFNTACLLF